MSAAHPPDDAVQPSHAAMEQAAQWYALLISDQVREQDRQRWQSWIASAPDHRRAWRYVEQVSQRMLAPLKDSPDPRQTTDSMHSANLRLRRRRGVMTGLAGVGVLAGAGLLGVFAWRQTPLRGMLLAWRADHSTAVGEIREVRLQDGSSVWLNTASAFDADFRPELRRLRLVLGEILVNTAADASRPFVVDTLQGRLRALGTRFTVRQEENQTFLAVYQGAVEIRPSRSDTAVVIRAGQQTRFTDSTVLPATPADPARQAWHRNVLIALNLPMQEVVQELRRYTLGHIGMAPEVAGHRVFGTFPLNDIDDTLALLAKAGNFRVRRPLPWWTTLEAADSLPSGSPEK